MWTSAAVIFVCIVNMEEVRFLSASEGSYYITCHQSARCSTAVFGILIQEVQLLAERCSRRFLTPAVFRCSILFYFLIHGWCCIIMCRNANSIIWGCCTFFACRVLGVQIPAHRHHLDEEPVASLADHVDHLSVAHLHHILLVYLPWTHISTVINGRIWNRCSWSAL